MLDRHRAFRIGSLSNSLIGRVTWPEGSQVSLYFQVSLTALLAVTPATCPVPATGTDRGIKRHRYQNWAGFAPVNYNERVERLAAVLGVP